MWTWQDIIVAILIIGAIITMVAAPGCSPYGECDD